MILNEIIWQLSKFVKTGCNFMNAFHLTIYRFMKLDCLFSKSVALSIKLQYDMVVIVNYSINSILNQRREIYYLLFRILSTKLLFRFTTTSTQLCFFKSLFWLSWRSWLSLPLWSFWFGLTFLFLWWVGIKVILCYCVEPAFQISLNCIFLEQNIVYIHFPPNPLQ